MYNVHMNMIEFVWDNRKDKANQKKHGISFEEAKTAFYDQDAYIYYDPDHSQDEDRFILLGNSFKSNTLVVCHCYRDKKDEVIRIISARKANKREKNDYRRQK